MDKSQVERTFQLQVQNLIDQCPHCNARTHISCLFFESHEMRDRSLVYFATFRCVPCKRLMVKTFRFTQNQFDSGTNLSADSWIEKFPDESSVDTGKFEGVVPRESFEDFREGSVCLHRGCQRAAVSMFRRALQSALLERGSDPKKDLIDQIRDATFLTDDIKDWSHNIRIFGNWGAHPQDDNLKDVTKEVAEETKAFLEEFFNYVYIMPQRVLSARQKNSVTPAAPAQPDQEDTEA